MHRFLEDPGRLIAELKRRRVFRVVVFYAVAAWVVIEAASVILPALRLPEWTITLVVVLAILGLPIALALAWAFDITPEGVARTAPTDVAARADRPVRPRRSRARLGAAVVVLLAASAGWMLWRRSGEPVAAPQPENVIAVLPFTVRAGPDLSYLREGMVNLLSTKLDGAGDVRSIDPHAVIGILTQEGDAPDAAAAGPIAARAGAGSFIMGDVTAAGRGLHLNATLYGPGAEPVARAAVEGPADSLLDLVDDLAAQLLAGRAGGRAGRVTRVAALTTHSLPALKAYLEGEHHFRRGNFRSALEAFRDATAIDTSFALAYYRLSIGAEWAGETATATAAAEAAQARIERLSERDRMLVRAMVAWRQGRGAEAERRYRAIVGRYPDDVEAWFQLAEVLFHDVPLRGGSATVSRGAFQRVLSYDANHVASLWHLARVAALERDTAELNLMTDRIRALAPEGDRTLELVALRAFMTGDGAAQRDVERALSNAIDATRYMAVWNVAVCGRDLEAAHRLAELLTDPSRSPSTRIAGHVSRAMLALARGRPGDARSEIDVGSRLDPSVGVMYGALLTLMPLIPASREDRIAVREVVAGWRPQPAPSEGPLFGLGDITTDVQPQVRAFLLGVLDARLGEPEDALRRATELETLPGSHVQRTIARHLANTVRGEAALAAGDTAGALAALDGVFPEVFYPRHLWSPYYTMAHARYLRAELLAATGRPREALRWFDSFHDYSHLDLAYDAAAHLRRGQILDAIGENERAAVHYARFVSLWRDADPELQPRVDAARSALERLTAAGGDRADAQGVVR